MRPRLVVWGTGGHALVVVDILRLRGEYEIAGFLDDLKAPEAGVCFCAAPLLGGQEQLDALRQRGLMEVLLAFGDNHARLARSALLREQGFRQPAAIHPQAVVAADVTIGPGTVIAAGAVVNPAAVLGENVIVNTCASVDHECMVEAGAHICPGAHLAGQVRVGRAAWVGIGAAVRDRMRVGAGSIIGAGAVVVKDVPEGVVVYGNPARVVRKIADHEQS